MQLKSCLTCAKAKSKCVRRPDQPICERCIRLRKDCQIRTTNKRKRGITENTTQNTATQLRSLETSIEKLTHSLSSNTAPGALNAPTMRFTTNLTDQSPCHHIQAPQLPLSRASVEPNPACSPVETIVTDCILSAHEMENLLDRYQRRMAPHMPFVVIPLGLEASALAQSEPILLKAITAVAAFHDTAKQQTLFKHILRQICEKVLVNGEKSLGILQGLLILLNWYNPQIFFPQNSTNLLHLAMALSTNLDLDRGPGPSEKAQVEAVLWAYEPPRPAKVLSNDERRAVIGIFYLSSLMSSSFRKPDILAWTPWLDECICVLKTSGEYDSDHQLVRLVQMQRILQEATTVDSVGAPVHIYAKSLLCDLAVLQESEDDATRLQEACTIIAIWQRAFASLDIDAVGPRGLRQQLDGMWRCMEAVKIYFDLYLAIPAEEYLVLPFRVFAQFAYAFGVSLRAFSIQVDGWNVDTLRDLINLSSIINETLRRFEAASQARFEGLDLNVDAFKKWSARLCWAKDVFDRTFTSASSCQQRSSQVVIDQDIDINISIPGDEHIGAGEAAEAVGHSWTSMNVIPDEFWATLDDLIYPPLDTASSDGLS